MSFKINPFLRRHAAQLALLAVLPPGATLADLQPGDAFPPPPAALLEGTLPDLAGQVVLIDFWASWCGPCKKSFPAFDRLYTEFKDRGFALLAVSVDTTASDVEEFLLNHPVSFPVVRDREQKYVEQFGINTMPTSVLVDASGRIRALHSGFRGEETTEQLRVAIEKLLSERQP
jgi:thiol-disulfide isomerase/thioredoxin